MISIYLDTSVINFLFADDAPEKKEVTIDLFDNFIQRGLYNTYISEYVLQEVMNTNNVGKRELLVSTIESYGLSLLELNDYKAIDDLAETYLQHGIIPPKKKLDALHIACSVIHHIDYLVSWNYKHLANVNRERKVIAMNLEKNYLHPIRIITPLELIDYGI